MDKRSFIAWVLIAAVWIIWLEYFAPKPQPAPKAIPNAAPAATAAPAAAPAAALAAAPTSAKGTAAPAAGSLGKIEEERRLTADTPLVKAQISTWGGGLVGYQLKNYRREQGGQSPLIDLFPSSEPGSYFPRWQFEVDGVKVSDAGLYRAVEAGPLQFILERELVAGLTLRKIFVWNPQNYLVQSTVELFPSGKSPLPRQVTAQALLPVNYEPSKNSFFGSSIVGSRGVLLLNGKVQRLSFEEKEHKPVQTAGLTWAGIDTHYFLKAYIPAIGMPDAWKVEQITSGNKVDYQAGLAFLPRQVKSDDPGRWTAGLYIGPKLIRDLQAADHDLERAIDLGDWLGPIARPMLTFLNWLYRYVGNYGIAIIILTVLVRLLLNPLNAVQIKQSKRMQQLQPELAAIKEKFKDDKMRQQQETMQLFKRNKVNPMGGCLPMLVQIPIFIALYRVLYNAIELRHAPFFLWITDLSAKDPYFITPILLGGLMFLQQKLTPMMGDPAQQAALKFMPLMFTVFMLWLPSGLTLYFFFSTLLGVIQQWRLMRQPTPA